MKTLRTGTVPVTAPMPDRDELTSDPTPVTPKQHKWVRRVVGALGYYANTTRFDISYEVNRGGPIPSSTYVWVLSKLLCEKPGFKNFVISLKSKRLKYTRKRIWPICLPSVYVAASVRRRLFDESESLATQMPKHEVKA